MKKATSENDKSRDPQCGMSVDPVTALRGDRDGTTFYFCSEQCRTKFLSASANPAAGADEPGTDKPKDKAGCCCS